MKRERLGAVMLTLLVVIAMAARSSRPRPSRGLKPL